MLKSVQVAIRRGLIRSAILAVALVGCASIEHRHFSVPSQTVTFEELKQSESSTEWLLYGHDYGNSRFTPMDTIDTSNVANLEPAYIIQTGVLGEFEASPIVSNGVMYLSTAYDNVLAIDARTGRRIWRYTPDLGRSILCCGPANRGVAISEGLVFIGQLDGKLVALDQETGHVVWSAHVSRSPQYSITMAPLAYKDEVLIGVAGGEFGIRGFLAAYSIDSGRELWRWYSTNSHDWAGDFSPRTALGEDLHRDIASERRTYGRFRSAWLRGGGGIWATPAIDVQRDEIYLATGNPWPASGESRPGDDRHTDSIVALNAKSGKLRWAFQEVPHDTWDRDAASPPFLTSTRAKDGRMVAAVAEAGKTGWLYILDRATGRLVGDPVKVGSRIGEDEHLSGASPGASGGVTWSPIAVDRELNYGVVVAVHRAEDPASRRKHSTGDIHSRNEQPGSYGFISGVDLTKREIAWQHQTTTRPVGGALTTAGGLTFVGESSGFLDALSTRTGRLLWQFQLGAAVNAPPIAFSVGDDEYIAVAAGGNQQIHTSEGDVVGVFRLKH